MQFLLLIYHNEAEYEKRPAAQTEVIHKEYRELMAELGQKGKLLAGGQLKSTSTATTVRVRDGKRAAANRLLHGRSKAERNADAAREAKAHHHLDQHRVDTGDEG